MSPLSSSGRSSDRLAHTRRAFEDTIAAASGIRPHTIACRMDTRMPSPPVPGRGTTTDEDHTPWPASPGFGQAKTQKKREREEVGWRSAAKNVDAVFVFLAGNIMQISAQWDQEWELQWDQEWALQWHQEWDLQGKT